MSNPTAAWNAPFAAFVVSMGVADLLHADPATSYAMRSAAALAAILLFSRGTVRWRPERPWTSLLLGASVFLIWVVPDWLWPEYRRHWLFANVLTGGAQSRLPEALRAEPAFLALRSLGATLIVPVAEELFWRGWLLRRLISRDFDAVPLGTYDPRAFWLTAVLFAVEHGAYWDVGLAAGLVYNAWVVRTKNLADCMLAHAVTNGCLAAYVLGTGAWGYWGYTLR